MTAERCPAPLHHAAEQHVTETGWRVICGCGKSFDRTDREDAVGDWSQHTQVVQLRRALNRADETKENDGA